MSRKPARSNPSPITPEPSTIQTPPSRPPFQPGLLWREFFGIDLRSLALFRIALGLHLLADIFMRWVDLEAFYTDFGVLPTGEWMHRTWYGQMYFTFHSIAGPQGGLWESVLFGVNMIFVLLFLFGWNTRIANIICWLFLISVHSRDPLILQGGDVLLRCLTFWGMFLPLGSYLALDARKVSLPILPGEDPNRPVYALSAGTIGALLQMVYLYLFTSLLKSDPVWWNTGYAVYIALNLDMLTKPLGRWVVQYPPLTYVLTYLTIWIEGFAMLAAFSPFKHGPLRTATVFLFLFFHLIALQSMMYLGPFPYTCAVGWFVFLPSWFWDRIALWWQKGTEKSLRKRLSEWAQPYLPKKNVHSDPRRILGLPIPAQVLAGFYLIVLLGWNIRTVNFGQVVHWFPSKWDPVTALPHVDQCWDMFSPKPMMDDGWFVIVGRLRDGTELDFMPYLAEYGDPKPVTWEKPKEVGLQFRDERWRKYFLNLLTPSNDPFRGLLLEYIVRRWNRNHKAPKDLCTVELVYMREDTPMQYAVPGKPFRVSLCYHWVSAEFAPKNVKPSPSPSPSPTPSPAPTASVAAPVKRPPLL